MRVVTTGDGPLASELEAEAVLLPFQCAEVTRAVAEVAHGHAVGISPYLGTPPYVYRDSWDVEAKVDGPRATAQLYNTVPYARKLETQYQVAERAVEGLDLALEAALLAALSL